MAAGTVLTVLSNIPWGQVIDAAPRIAEGAGRLWEAARNLRKTRAPEPEGPDASGAPLAEPTESERMQARIADLEASVQAMREQMQASAQVVKELADQNALLVQRIEVARQRVVLLAAAGAVVALALMASLALLWRQIA